MRAEMGAVLKSDYNGRKVRYIGDCIHGLIAEGDRTETHAMQTVKWAVRAAAGLRSSFDLCKSMLPGVESLGLAIGIDYGATPICRLGLRGEGSVRTAASRATCSSETAQKICDGLETALGESAYKAAPASIREVFGSERKVRGLDAETADLLLSEIGAPYIGGSPQAEPLRAHQSQAAAAAPLRAHFR